jgi:AcrR family transcriptional regulator
LVTPRTRPDKAGSPKRKRRSAHESRHKLLQAARDEFRRFGFSGATTAAIARNAGTSEAHLFRHFPSKAELFQEAVFEALNEHFSAFNAKNPPEMEDTRNRRHQVRLYISELQEFLREHSNLLLSLIAAQTFTSGALNGKTEIDSLKAYFKRGSAMMRKRVHGKTKVDPNLLVRVTFAAVLGCVIFRHWVCPAGTANDAEFSEACIDFLIEGISVNSDPGWLAHVEQ